MCDHKKRANEIPDCRSATPKKKSQRLKSSKHQLCDHAKNCTITPKVGSVKAVFEIKFLSMKPSFDTMLKLGNPN